MKKVIALFAMLGISASAAFAQAAKEEPKTKMDVALTSMLYSTAYDTVKKDEGGSFTAIRFRPTMTITNGNIDGVLQLQYDAMFGAQSGNDKEDTANYNVGLEGKHNNLQVRQAYLSAKVDDIAGLKLVGGIMPYDFPLVFGDSAPMFGATFEKGNVFAQIYYAKTYEGDASNSTDDSQFGIADVTIKFGDSSIRPAFFYLSTKKAVEQTTSGGDVIPGTNFRAGHGYIGAIAANFVFGKAGIDASGTYIRGKDKDDTTDATTKFSSYAADFAPYIKLNDSFKLTAFGTLISGDDDTTDGKDTSFINGTLDGINSGINIWRLYIIEDGGTFGKFSDVTNAGKYSNTNGYWAAGLSADASISKLTVKATVAYAAAMKVASGTDKGMGIETDLHLEYAVTKGANVFLEGAFLKAGDYYGSSKQNAKYVNAGATVSL